MREMNAVEFICVFEATKNGLYQLFRQQTGDESQTEDLVQECYLRLWEKREGLEDPKSYVFGIAYHMIKEFHRKKIRAAIHQMELLPAEELPEIQDPYSPDEQYQFKETMRIVRETIGGLSPEKRAAFTLIKGEERSYKEAADLLDVPVSTLEKQVAASMKILRKALTIWMFLLWMNHAGGQ